MGTPVRIRLSALRWLIKEELSLLTESRCPVCGTEGAYVGLNDVECVNPRCTHYAKPAPSHNGGIRESVPDRASLEAEFPGALRAWRKFLIDCEDIDGSVSIDDLFSETQWLLDGDGTLYANYEGDVPNDAQCKWDGKSWKLSEGDI